jgi:hypothetical protein
MISYARRLRKPAGPSNTASRWSTSVSANRGALAISYAYRSVGGHRDGVPGINLAAGNPREEEEHQQVPGLKHDHGSSGASWRTKTSARTGVSAIITVSWAVGRDLTSREHAARPPRTSPATPGVIAGHYWKMLDDCGDAGNRTLVLRDLSRSSPSAACYVFLSPGDHASKTPTGSVTVWFPSLSRDRAD